MKLETYFNDKLSAATNASDKDIGKEIKRTIEVEIIPTPYELAHAFWSMGEREQALFFNHLGLISEDRLPFQLQAISQSDDLADDGRYAMNLIGDYSEQAQ